MKKAIFLAAGLAVFLTACENNESKEEENEAPVMEQTPISLKSVNSPEFPDAKISMGKVEAKADGNNVKVTFNFNVENYELMNQTDDAQNKMCANSDKGQHIHFILDNEPYAALYEPKHEVSLEKGSEHYLLAFLSRSYHESIKSKGASLLYHFKVDENGKIQQLEEPTSAMVFYSRPKGDYVGENNTTNLLFDYFVWNTDLSDHKVKAHIQAGTIDTTLMMDDWKANFIENMPIGKDKITLTLVDKDGNKVDGPMTEVTREFTLAQEEPMATE